MILNHGSYAMKGQDDFDFDDSTIISTNSSLARRRHKSEHESIEVAVEEQQRVTLSKHIMVFVLLLVATVMGTATYQIVKTEENEAFEREFQNYASEIVAVAREHVNSSFGSIESFAHSISSFAKASGQTWPNVTIPDYTSRAIRLAQLAADSRLVTFSPFVEEFQRKGFEDYARSIIHHQIQEDLDYLNLNATATELEGIPDQISYFNLSAKAKFIEKSSGPFLVNWQRYPFETSKKRIFVMNNMLRIPTIRSAVLAASASQKATSSFLEALLGIESQVIQPVFQEVLPPHRSTERRIVGVVWVVLSWANYFQNLLPSGVNGIYVVLRSSCGFETTFLINGLVAEELGLGDFHDENYDDLLYEAKFINLNSDEVEVPVGVCIDNLSLLLYPSNEFKDAYISQRRYWYTATVVAIFIFTMSVFLLFDWAVRRRQAKVLNRVYTQDRIVSNLFPGNIKAQLYGNNEGDNISVMHSVCSQSKRNLFDKDLENPELYRGKPVANLHLQTSVIFADISGFTAWASTREPTQVLRLLETLYGAFDKISHKHRVFKIETIGDCYVAVSGLPEPDSDHAVNMAKFAREIMHKMTTLVKKLEISLGIGTADLKLRIGIHSGQVTAGVLRGERSRFQLFGDTVNTTSRMESTGQAGRVQISSYTADLLRSKGRANWITEREDLVAIKGKEDMRTCWLLTRSNSLLPEEQNAVKLGDEEDSTTSDDDGSESDAKVNNLTKRERLIEWHVDTLSDLLRQIIAARNSYVVDPASSILLSSLEECLGRGRTNRTTATFLEECKDIISLPRVRVSEILFRDNPEEVELDFQVINQLRSLITKISFMYPDNPFHNFEHASHVTSSVQKMLTRIVDVTKTTNANCKNVATTSAVGIEDWAEHAYGITSDPLTQFAVIFSAVIHDLYHPGVPNAQLVEEGAPMVEKYKQSIAEQNSLDAAWRLLMSPEFFNLRRCIYSTEAELLRFRQLFVNTVMATDICDKELGAIRKQRWKLAFAEELKTTAISSSSSSEQDTLQSEDTNRKATIVIEHLIQASDVSHTMQHWNIYRFWNERFFDEQYSAYLAGRAKTDPSIGWYKGEIGFFDFYIIPLAKKLESCGVFGVSSQEYLSYALQNRNEWERRGEEVVREYLENYPTREQEREVWC